MSTREKFDSGNASYDAKVNSRNGLSVMTGNVISDAQFSSFIRAHACTECNGFTREPGHLQAFDLRPFASAPRSVLRRVRERATTESVILYRVRHWRGEREIVHGYIITSADRRAASPAWEIVGSNGRGTSLAVLHEFARHLTLAHERDRERRNAATEEGAKA